MTSFPPIVTDFKTFFDRDFRFGTGMDTVRDSDITNALLEAGMFIRASNFDTSSSGDGPLAWLWCAAHLLVTRIQAAGGLSPVAAGRGVDSSGGGPILSKSVGSVSLQIALPESVVQNPMLSQFARTDYGLRFLQLLTPYLIGNVFAVGGWDDTGTQVDL